MNVPFREGNLVGWGRRRKRKAWIIDSWPFPPEAHLTTSEFEQLR